jgi:nucleolar protein 12
LKEQVPESLDEDSGSVANSEDLSSVSEQDSEVEESEVGEVSADEEDGLPTNGVPLPSEDASPERKRKRRRDEDDIEGQYMERIAREEAKEEAKKREERQSKRQKASSDSEDGSDEDESMGEGGDSDDEEDLTQPDFDIPVHEALAGPEGSEEFQKANRTVFLGNVSSSAMTSKTAKKTLLKHLASFISSLPEHSPPHTVESIRFRSTAYSNKIPKKAAFAKKELMDATTRSTHAYAVYSTKVAAREAARVLNGTVVLDRHLHVDEVAHPAKTEARRCVFIGNLPFVDDESAMRAAEAEESGRKARKQEPSDIEEGLWREFSKIGTVESVRVVRDPKTRVGKGFAYVQFKVSTW